MDKIQYDCIFDQIPQIVILQPYCRDDYYINTMTFVIYNQQYGYNNKWVKVNIRIAITVR